MKHKKAAMTQADFARMGGLARAKKLSKARQSEIGRAAVMARWAKYRAAKKMVMLAVLAYLALL